MSSVLCERIFKAGGAIVVEWNIASEDGEQGTAAMFDTHIRLGGGMVFFRWQLEG